jgi:hypothetical protein
MGTVHIVPLTLGRFGRAFRNHRRARLEPPRGTHRNVAKNRADRGGCRRNAGIMTVYLFLPTNSVKTLKRIRRIGEGGNSINKGLPAVLVGGQRCDAHHTVTTVIECRSTAGAAP